MSVHSTRRIARSLVAAVTPFLLTACVTVMGAVRPASSRAALTHLVDSLTTQPEFRNAQWGVLIVNPRTGDTLYSKNAGKLFQPASNMKIITSAAALTLLGPDYTYKTTFLTSGEKRDSVMDGDLLVIGRGDPTVSDRMQGFVIGDRFRGLATTVMDALADSVRAHGINQISGSLARVGNAFPDSIWGVGWQWDDLGEYYGAGIDELIFNEGTAPTTLRPAPDTIRDSLYSGPAKNPGKAYLDALKDALVRKGVAVETGVMDTILSAPMQMDTLFVFTSRPLRDILPVLMKPSQNQVAELVFRTIGLERGGIGAVDTARKIVAQQLLAWGVQPDGFVMRDGSGLSDLDLLTPETIVRVLDRIQRDTAFAAFYNSMPIAGVDGTIEKRMKGTPAEGNVRAKTGTLTKARSLSGYVTTADGERLIFSVLANNTTTPGSRVTGVADQIGAALAAYRGP